MIKINKNLFIYFPSINLYEKDILHILKILKSNNLNNLLFKIGNYHTNDIEDFFYNGVVDNLIIEFTADNPKNNFFISFNPIISFISYFEEIENLNLGVLISIEDFIKTKKTIAIPKKILNFIALIIYLFFIFYLFVYYQRTDLPLITNLFYNLLILLFIDFYVLERRSMSKIIFKIYNPLKRFYFNHYSLFNFFIFIILNILFIILIIFSYLYDFTFLGFKF